MISPEFLEADLPSGIQKFLLVLLAFFVPPLPIYLLSGPRFSFGTKEFIISCVLSICFFVIGVFYSLIFILQLFPAARAEAGRDGYIRVGDDETQTGGHTEVRHQSGDIQQPEVVAKKPESFAPIATTHVKDDVNKDSANEPLLPTYEESEGNSRGDVHNDMAKFGDNKVQH